MRILQLKYHLILLLLAVQIQHINCSLSVLNFIEAACHLNQQIESFQKSLIQQRQNFLDNYEKIVAPTLVRNKYVEPQIPNLYLSSNQESKQQKVELTNLDIKDSSLCQDSQCINSNNKSRRILQTSNNDGQVGNQQQPDNQDDDIKQKKLIYDDQDDQYLKTFVQYENDPFIFHIYMKEQVQLEYNLGSTDVNDSFDTEYQVPMKLIYYSKLSNQTYKIIRQPEHCPSSSQKIIQKRYFYYCDQRRVFIQQYVLYKKQNVDCYKIEVYIEACHCPYDKYGTFCSDQVPITCNVHRKIDQVDTQKNQNGSKQNENTLGVFYDKVGTLESQGFSINIKCNNQRGFVDIINKRFQTINGLCTYSDMIAKNECIIKQFNYTYFDSDSNQLKITDDIKLHFILEVSNLKKISQPLILNYTFPTINSDMLLGKQSFNIPLYLKDIQNTFPQFQSSDFLQFGKLWYSMKIIGEFQQSNFTDSEINLGYWNGVLVDESYVEPKLNYFQLLTINQWDLLDYVFVLLTFFLLLVVCLILIYLFTNVKKLFTNFASYLYQLKQKSFQKNQMSQVINDQNNDYEHFNDV
ncbi:transmembrane protein, putative (macronuclear) [Tetrahymena thermophila SB210]|uniref:Transmembrane protein, putative n=1 Tax=Tetrahymena thermophila (strain SB210) TaxID=312017 RepID=I7MAU0_TETTS|nr:transmembrane protein, putative [Tetrahymena thermophila SB210]EAS06138.2 transmembrane protein, putative [Tetrahymena thermophila SB210]|eukprot:XP_001026383.2 transmembrane protein, putative [Tetrahymena thermophila SB210]